MDRSDAIKVLELIGFKSNRPCRDCGGDIWMVKNGEKYQAYDANLDKHYKSCPNARPRSTAMKDVGKRAAQEENAPF